MNISEKQYMGGSAFGYVNFDYSEDGKKLSPSSVEEQYGQTLKDLHAKQRYENQGEERREQVVKYEEKGVFQSVEDWKLIAYQNKNDTTGFCASAFETQDGRVVFAFRGTEPGTIDHGLFPEDGKPDAAIVAARDFKKELAPQFEDAKAFIKTTLGKKYGFDPDTVTDKELRKCVDDNHVTSTGHSLGGGLSEYFTYKTGGQSVTFNAVGIGQNFGLTAEEAAKFPVVNIANKNDLVGNTGLHLGEQRNLEGNIYPSDFSQLLGMITPDHGMHTMVKSFDNNDNLTTNLAVRDNSYVSELCEKVNPHLASAGRILEAKGTVDFFKGMDHITDGFETNKRAITNYEEAKTKVIKENIDSTNTKVEAIIHSSTNTLKEQQSKLGNDIGEANRVISDGTAKASAVIDANSNQIHTGLHTTAAGGRDLGYGFDPVGAAINTGRKISNGDSIPQAMSSEAQDRWNHITQGASEIRTGLAGIGNGIANDYNGIKNIAVQGADKIKPVLSDLKAMYNTLDKNVTDIQAASKMGQDNMNREINALSSEKNDKLLDGFKDIGQGIYQMGKGAVKSKVFDSFGVVPAKDDSTQQASSTAFFHSNSNTVQIRVLEGDNMRDIANALGTTPDQITNEKGQRVYLCNPDTIVNVKTNAGANGNGIYTVQSGDDWEKISKRIGVTYDELRSVNPNLGEGFSAGTVINYPKHQLLDMQAINSPTAKTQDNSNCTLNVSYLPRQSGSTTIPVKVLDGDSLVQIANSLNITPAQLTDGNGNQIYVCNPNTVIHAEVHLGTNGNVLYQVQPGDDWGTISKRIGVSYDDLRAANPQMGEGFSAGTMINAPKSQGYLHTPEGVEQPSQSTGSQQGNFFNQKLSLHTAAGDAAAANTGDLSVVRSNRVWF